MRRTPATAVLLLAGVMLSGHPLAGPGVAAQDTPGSVSTSASPVPVAPASPSLGGERPPALAPTEVFGYLPSWELDDGDPIDFTQLTTLAWFGVEAGPDGHLMRTLEDGSAAPGWQGWMSEAFAALTREAQASGARVVLTVERFAWTADDAAETVALLGDPAARSVLVGEIVATVLERGTDGAHLDVEPLPAEVRDGLSALVRELRAAMNAADPGLQLTVALTPDMRAYDVRALTRRDAADAVVLLGYEYRTPSSARSGSLAPLTDRTTLDLRESVSAVLRRAPPERVILALPWYGRAWTTRDEKPGARTRSGDRFLGPTTARYEVAVARAEVSGRRYEPRQASAWGVYPSSACDTCPVSPRQLWYDDVDAFGAKIRFALRQGLRGIGIWALGYQGTRPELWSALRVARGAVTDTDPPTGSATVDPASVVGVQDGRPVVGDTIGLDLVAGDGSDGTGVAFVRISTSRRLRESGELRSGVTFPNVDHVDLDVATGRAAQEVFRPAGPAPSADASLDPSPAPTRTPSGGAPPAEPRTLFVQWRDVAGTWSAPVAVRVWHESGATPPVLPSTVP